MTILVFRFGNIGVVVVGVVLVVVGNWITEALVPPFCAQSLDLNGMVVYPTYIPPIYHESGCPIPFLHTPWDVFGIFLKLQYLENIYLPSWLPSLLGSYFRLQLLIITHSWLVRIFCLSVQWPVTWGCQVSTWVWPSQALAWLYQYFQLLFFTYVLTYV